MTQDKNGGSLVGNQIIGSVEHAAHACDSDIEVANLLIFCAHLLHCSLHFDLKVFQLGKGFSFLRFQGADLLLSMIQFLL